MNFTIFPPVFMAVEVALAAWAEGETAALQTAAANTHDLLTLSVKLSHISCRYPKWLNEFSATVQSKLNILNMEVEAIEKRIELLEEILPDAAE